MRNNKSVKLQNNKSVKVQSKKSVKVQTKKSVKVQSKKSVDALTVWFGVCWTFDGWCLKIPLSVLFSFSL